jgi:hypothetical protein
MGKKQSRALKGKASLFLFPIFFALSRVTVNSKTRVAVPKFFFGDEKSEKCFKLRFKSAKKK